MTTNPDPISKEQAVNNEAVCGYSWTMNSNDGMAVMYCALPDGHVGDHAVHIRGRFTNPIQPEPPISDPVPSERSLTADGGGSVDSHGAALAGSTPASRISDPVQEAREALFWKLQDSRSHMQANREAAEAFEVYDALIRAQDMSDIQELKEALELIADAESLTASQCASIARQALSSLE